MPIKAVKKTTKASIKKGVADSTFGSQLTSNSVAPKATKNMARSLTPIEAYELCSSVRSAIRARNEPFGQIKIRLFLRSSGAEITGGEAVEFWTKPNPSQYGTAFLQAISSWNDLAGERSCWVRPGPDGKQLAHVLNPFSLKVMGTEPPAVIEEIKQWQYTWENGKYQTITPDQVVFEHDFNPSSLVRGNSPLIAVVNSITASYQAQRYIKAFFSNNSRPSSIINVDTDNPDLVEPFKKEYLSAMQGEGNAWMSFFTYGKKVDITPIEAPLSDSPFQQLILNVRDEVAGLYMVPPLHGGMWDKTRFDSIRDQNRFFFESVWLPRLAVIQAYSQRMMDEQLKFSSVTSSKKAVFTKSMADKFDKAKLEAKSDIVIVLDCDHIPAISELKQQKIMYAQQLMDTFKITPAEASIEVGLDLNLNKAADMVWFKSDQKYIDTTIPAKPTDNTPSDATPPSANANATTEAPKTAQDNAADSAVVDDIPETDNLKSFYRALRKLTLEKSDNGERWTLNEADNLAKQHECFSATLYTQIRRDFVALSELTKAKDKDGIKKYFNTKKPSVLKQIAKGQ